MKKTICKHCGQEHEGKVKICMNCGKKIKKPIYKRVWFIILIVLLLSVPTIRIIGELQIITHPYYKAVNDMVGEERAFLDAHDGSIKIFYNPHWDPTIDIEVMTVRNSGNTTYIYLKVDDEYKLLTARPSDTSANGYSYTMQTFYSSDDIIYFGKNSGLNINKINQALDLMDKEITTSWRGIGTF